MKYDLATMWRRARNPRRREVVLRKVEIPSMLAADLFQGAYLPIIKEWNASIDAIMAEYERTLSQMTQDAPADVSQVVTETESRIAAVMLTVRARLERWAIRVEAAHRRKWRGAILTATGVDVNTLIGPADMRMTMSAAVERNAGLVRSVSDEARRRIADSVFRGFQRRAAPREVATELREAVGLERRRALRIAADQNVKLGAALNDERRREAGLSAWEWVASGKVHYRPEHKARNGKRYDDDAKSGPHKPPEDRPGQLPYCGCTSRAVLSLDGNSDG